MPAIRIAARRRHGVHNARYHPDQSFLLGALRSPRNAAPGDLDLGNLRGEIPRVAQLSAARELSGLPRPRVPLRPHGFDRRGLSPTRRVPFIRLLGPAIEVEAYLLTVLPEKPGAGHQGFHAAAVPVQIGRLRVCKIEGPPHRIHLIAGQGLRLLEHSLCSPPGKISNPAR